ncbi:MAG: toprim domain-containing protein, partial [Cuniculiplasma sp.]
MALGTDFRALYDNNGKTPNIAAPSAPPAADNAPVENTKTDDAGTTRRIRQSARLYHNLKDLAPTKVVTDYQDARGVDIAAAIAAGARFGQIPRADLQNKAPKEWIKGESADAILWPIYRAETILKTTRVLSGVQREWPWGCQDGPKSVKAILGKHFLDRRAGGFLIGTLAGAKILYICEGPLTGIAIHMATGQPVLVLISEGGLRNIAPATISDIRDSGLCVVIAGDNDKNGVGQKASQICARKILLAAPNVQVSISIPDVADTDWLDVLNTHGPEETARLILANSHPPTLPQGPRGG